MPTPLASIRVLIVNCAHLMAKHFRHQDTKMNINQKVTRFAWCLGGNLFRLVRVRLNEPVGTISDDGFILRHF
jgi:hypothetical protein